MERRTKRRILTAWLLCALAIAAVFATGILNRGKTWEDVSLEFAGGKAAVNTENGDAYGVVSGGPYIDLPPGEYRIKWQIDGDGDNFIHLKCSNDAQITPSVIETRAGVWQDEAWFEIKEPAHNFSIAIEFASGTWMQTYNIRLYSPEYTDHAFSFALLLIALCAMMTAHACGYLTSDRIKVALVLALAVLLVSAAYLQEDHAAGFDTQFHAARLCNLADGLAGGQFPARAGGFSYNGYGALTSVFYPDLLLYPFAALLLGGASIAYVLNVLAVAIHAVTAVCMYAAAKGLLKNRQEALCASIVYLLSMHRITGMYWRYAVGEMLAMAFLPLFVWALYELLWGEKTRWPLLAVSATLVFRSHLITTVLCAMLAVACGVLRLPAILREKRIGAIAKGCALTLLINLNQIVPMLTSYLSGVKTSVNQWDFWYSALSLSELIGSIDGMGAALLFGAAAFVWTGLEKDRREDRASWLCLFGGGVCMLLCTKLIPWDHVAKVFGILVSLLQFPWRFQILGTVLLSACAGVGFSRILGEKQAAMLTLIIAALCVLPYEADMHPSDTPLEFGQGANAYMIYPEYQLEGTDLNDTRSREPLLTGEVQLTDYRKDGTTVTVQVDAATDAAITLPLFGFDGYAAELNGERIDWTRGENNRLTVAVPAGTQGEIHIWFEGKMLWRIADGISVISALSWIGYVLTRRKEGFGHGAY